MKIDSSNYVPAIRAEGGDAAEVPIAHLVAQVYESAPPALRADLLQQLIQPLGVLSLVAIANGIFAKIRLHSAWPDLTLRLEDINQVQAKDIVALVERVQQISFSSISGLAKLLTASPWLTGSAAAALLVTVLMQRAHMRRVTDFDTDE